MNARTRSTTAPVMRLPLQARPVLRTRNGPATGGGVTAAASPCAGLTGAARDMCRALYPR